MEPEGEQFSVDVYAPGLGNIRPAIAVTAEVTEPESHKTLSVHTSLSPKEKSASMQLTVDGRAAG